MKLTESHLRQIIKKELKKILNESESYNFNSGIKGLATEYFNEGIKEVSVEDFAERLGVDDIEKFREDLFNMMTNDDEAIYWLRLEDRYGDAPETTADIQDIMIGDPGDI